MTGRQILPNPNFLLSKINSFCACIRAMSLFRDNLIYQKCKVIKINRTNKTITFVLIKVEDKEVNIYPKPRFHNGSFRERKFIFLVHLTRYMSKLLWFSK